MAETSSSASSDQRAQQVCGFGLAVQLAVLCAAVATAAWSGSDAIWAEAVHMAGGVAIWVALLVLYTQRKRAAAEAFETQELRRAAEAGASTAIFEATEESLHLERYRLRWIQRWFLPAFTIVLALFHIVMYVRWHVMFAKPLTDPAWSPADNPSLAAVIMAFAGFFCFLFSRYSSGMARSGQWRTLRAASTYLAGNALACLVLVAALGLRILNQPIAEPVAVYVVWFTILILGIEFAINFILDVYRPRVDVGELRPAFDSRLLALISEPGGVARSIAEAINYQFGFEVSATWFYQLLQRSMLPLAVFTMLALILLSSVVIVDADQQAVIERFGRPPAGDAVYGPGIHLKWPWPIDRVYRASVSHLETLIVGSEAPREEDKAHPHEEDPEKQIELWTEQHDFARHMMILVADPEGARISAGAVGEGQAAPAAPRERAVGVSLVKASLAIQYKARDLRDYLYRYEDPEGVLQAVAYQGLTDYAAGVDIDRITGPGRQAFEDGLRAHLQERIDGLGLGISIAFLGLQGCHPPNEDNVAAAFQQVISAEQKKDATIEAARGQAQQIKSQVAGSVERADVLDAAILEMDRLAAEPNASADEVAAARQRVDDLLLGNAELDIEPMSGQAAAEIADAQAAQTVAVARALSRQQLFEADLAAYQAAPRLYKTRKYLDMWQRVTANIRKTVVVADPQKTNLILILEGEKETILDLEEPESSSQK